MDGVLRIDTKIDDKGFNAGTDKMSGKIGGLLKSITVTMGGLLKVIGSGLTRISASLGAAFEAMGQALVLLFTDPVMAAIVLVLATIAAMVAFVSSSIGTAFRLAKDQTGDAVQRIKDRFEELKVAFGNAFLPLITAAAPYIEKFTTWLIGLFNKIAMITAALLGQKEVLQVVVGSLDRTGKKIEKSARGALAAFDQINVLNIQKDQQSPNTLAQMATELVPVQGEIVDKIEAIKEKFAKFKEWLVKLWDDVKQKIQDVKAWLDEFGGSMWQGFAVGGVIEFIKQKWEEFKPWFNEHIWQPLSQWASETWEKIKQWASEAKDAIFEKWANFSEWFSIIWNNVKQIVSDVISSIIEKWGNFKEWFAVTMANILAGALTLWNQMKKAASDAKENVIAVWQELSAWFGIHVLQPLMNGFNFALQWIHNKFVSIFSSIETFVIDILNGIIEKINGVLGDILGGFASGGLAMGIVAGGGNSKTNDTVAPRIPRLATGAVIPPNAQFAAVLGDQKNGRNLEAPEGLIRQIIREEMGNNSGNLTVQMPVYLDSEKIYDGVKKVEIRRGPSLIVGGI